MKKFPDFLAGHPLRLPRKVKFPVYTLIISKEVGNNMREKRFPKL